MTPRAHEVVRGDPLGVICDAVGKIEDGLSPEQVRAIVEAVSGGRAKRRQLAVALTERPAVLEDGRSPAPRSVGDLLAALRHAGATGVSAPRCAGCSKELRTLQRRGADWYCSVCVSEPITCALCGEQRQIVTRDRQGQPRCRSCLPEEDPLQAIVAVVASVDPQIPAAAVRAAVARTTSRAGQRRRLAWALEDRADLLTGAGAEAPAPSLLRFIDALLESGSEKIVRPPCPCCGRVRTLSKTREGLRICRNCSAKARAVSCWRCGAVREPATRDEQGHPLCPHCLSTDPANQEACIRCGRLRPVSVRSNGGPICPSCRPRKEATCSICGRLAPCEISVLTNKAWCAACQQRWARCSRCGEVRQLHGGSLEAPLCAPCVCSDVSTLARCPVCGIRAQQRAGPCARCTFAERVHQLLAGKDGEIRTELRGLYENLVATDQPDTVKSFIRKGVGAAVLRELASGTRPLSHAALDELGGTKPIEHLRAVLVATAALAPRDEQMARLERWVVAAVAERADPEERRLLQRYALWHLLRRLRQRSGDLEITHIQATVVKSHVRAAVALLDGFASHQLTLRSAGQGDLEAWLASDEAAYRRDVGHFLRWAASEKLTSLELPATRWVGPSGPIDTERRFATARSLLGEAAIDLGDRVAGLLVLLYAQPAAVISRLRVAAVEEVDGAVRLHLGTEPIVVPSPLDVLVSDLVANRRGHAALGGRGTSPWLFPGGQPGRPISASRLAERLRALGIHARPARSTALFGLASELPAALLARLLGIHISVAVQWQQASSGDWTRYAAEISRRPDH